MKCLRRYLSVLFVCVLLSVAFSVTANAETVKVPSYHIYAQSFICSEGTGTCSSNNSLVFYPNNGTLENKSVSFNTTAGVICDRELQRDITFTIATDDGSPLVKKGGKTTVSFTKFSNLVYIKNNSTNTTIETANSSARSAWVTYTDNTTEFYTVINAEWNIDYKYVNGEFSFTPQKDVKSIIIQFKNDLYDYTDDLAENTSITFTHYVGELVTDNEHNISITQQSEEAGILSGLLGWVQNIWNSVTDGFSALGESLTNGFSELKTKLQNVVHVISSLPEKLWTAISNGLQSLFIPDEQTMSEYSDRWDDLLSDRFGAVYQAGDMIGDFFNALSPDTDTVFYIEIPEFSLKKVGIDFTLGPYQVPLIPEEGNWSKLLAMIKIIVNIVCTFLFVNALRNRFDEIIGDISANYLK